MSTKKEQHEEPERPDTTMNKESDPLAAPAHDGEAPTSAELENRQTGSTEVPEKDGVASDVEEPQGLHGSLHGNWTRPNDR
jgi:hypothetical protein